jgi:arylsulfatase A-like enzyme
MGWIRTVTGLGACVLLALPAAAQQAPRNVVLFVADGLRAHSVTPESAPTMAAIRDQGVNFSNPHALFPTFTMPNSSGLATGHMLGDTGTFSNTMFVGYPVKDAAGSVTPFIENDKVLENLDAHFAEDYVNEETILKGARGKDFSTAAIGKVGPTLMFDHTARSGEASIIIDDATGSAKGIPLSAAMRDALTEAGLPLAAPSRGANGKPGNFQTPGTTVANVEQQGYFADVATKVVLPMFKARNKPFVLVFWSRDPDGTQHNQGDSFNALTPGINGPTSRAAVKNADDNLARLRAALDRLGLAAMTDIVVTADHGFTTISKQSNTSPAAHADYTDVPKGLLPPGFLALDIAKGLGLKLFDPDASNAEVAAGKHPAKGDALIGEDAEKPQVVVAANGGSDLIYLPTHDPALAARVVDELMHQDYVSGLFVDDALGALPGTLPLSVINLKGSARTPRPSIVVNFRSFSTGCGEAVMCTAEVADSPLQQGQGMHGSFSRAETMNFMAAIGPSFRHGYVDPAPVSNADVGKTIAHIIGLDIAGHGSLNGRVTSEAMPGGTEPAVSRRTVQSEPGAGGLRTVLDLQTVENTRYLDAGGFPGRTVGLTAGEHAER